MRFQEYFRLFITAQQHNLSAGNKHSSEKRSSRFDYFWGTFFNRKARKGVSSRAYVNASLMGSGNTVGNTVSVGSSGSFSQLACAGHLGSPCGAGAAQFCATVSFLPSNVWR